MISDSVVNGMQRSCNQVSANVFWYLDAWSFDGQIDGNKNSGGLRKGSAEKQVNVSILLPPLFDRQARESSSPCFQESLFCPFRNSVLFHILLLPGKKY